MVLVFVRCSQDLAAGRIKLLNKELKEFFENGEGKKCRVVSVYTRVTTSLNSEQKLVMGSPYLEETVVGLKFHLLPTMHFWNNSRAAEMVCKGVEELLVPTKRICVVEVGYGFGLVGLHLSRVAGEVLSVVSQQSVEEAQKNATRNKITNCHYFSGNIEAVLLEVAKKIGYKKACVVMICSANPRTTSTITMKAIRKIEKVRRLVIVTEMFNSRFNPIVALCNPSSEKGMGNPFFPVRAVPVDTVPNAEGYVLMILMERMGLPIPKSLRPPKSDPAIHWTEKGSDSHSAADVSMPYKKVTKETRLGERDARLTITSRREERELLRHREEKKSFRASGRHRFAGREYPAEGYFKRPSSDDESNALEEHDFRESKAEEQRRRTQEEECMLQIEEEKQRRLMEEQQRWVEERELKRQIEEKELKRQMGEREFRRQMEEKEFRRKIDEKEFKRQVEERELKRQIEEKEMKRQIEEQREREMLRRASLNLKNRNDMVQDLIADSLREANIPQLSEDTAQKLKQLIAEAVRSVGTLDQDARRSIVSTSTGFGGMHPENITISRFVRPDKDIPESRCFEERYSRHITEVDNPFERRYDVHGGELERSERYEEKLMPQSGCFEEGYSRSVTEVNSLYQHGYNAYEGAVERESYQHNLKPQQSVYSMREVPVGHIGVDRAGSQPPKLRDPSGGCSDSAPRLESGGDSYMRNVYHSDVSPSQRQRQSFAQSLDSYTRQNIFSSDYAGNERQPLQDLKPSLLPAVEHDTDSHARLCAMKWSLANTATSYVPLSNSRKYMACSTPKPPGTEDVNQPEGSNYMYEDPAPRVTNSSRWQGDNSSSYMTLETKDSTQDYRNRMHDGRGQDRTHQTRYFM
ncbi:uncharacterized protein LOC111873348 isoform X1 [Cryptotermes secundus]|nr:uncharacterized protein LOC111873348 isoform X1 [Cryptotermes secundus]